MAYTRYGPFTDGTAPGVSAEFLNPVEDTLVALNSAATDSNISAASGILTLIGLVLSGSGKIVLPNPGTAQSLTNGSTITISGPRVKVTSSGAITGVIMTAGTTDGQTIFLYNQGSNTITFAVSGSNVRNGGNVNMSGGRTFIMIWDASGAAWSTTSNS
jgi:hypothetical protein